MYNFGGFSEEFVVIQKMSVTNLPKHVIEIIYVSLKRRKRIKNCRQKMYIDIQAINVPLMADGSLFFYRTILKNSLVNHQKWVI